MSGYYTRNENYGEKFVAIPKVLLFSSLYKDLTANQKIAWAVLKDRHDLSEKNNWVDEHDRYYFLLNRDELAEILGCAKSTASEIRLALENCDLLEMKTYGNGNSKRLYIKKPKVTPDDIYLIKKSETLDISETTEKPSLGQKSQKSEKPSLGQKTQKSENPSFESRKNRLSSYNNDTELNETEINNKKAKAKAFNKNFEISSKKEGNLSEYIEILEAWDFTEMEIDEILTKLKLENLEPDDKIMVEQCKYMFDNPQVTGSKVGYFVNGIRYKLKPVLNVVPIQPKIEEAPRPIIDSDQLEALLDKVFPDHPANVRATVRRVYMKYRFQLSLTDYQIILNDFKPKIGQARNGNIEAFLGGFIKNYLNPAPYQPISKRKSAELKMTEPEKVEEKEDIQAIYQEVFGKKEKR